MTESESEIAFDKMIARKSRELQALVTLRAEIEMEAIHEICIAAGDSKEVITQTMKTDPIIPKFLTLQIALEDFHHR